MNIGSGARLPGGMVEGAGRVSSQIWASSRVDGT